jgi:hypothetical protein
MVSTVGNSSVGVRDEILENIKKIIIETKLYKNPTEFINLAVLEKIEKIHQLQVDRMKLEAFYSRENKIKTEHLGKDT